MLPNKQLTIVLAVVENNGRFLILRRIDENPIWHHKWELPGGKIEPGETPQQAMQRELWEETGLSINDFELLGVATHNWDLPDYTQQTFIIAYRTQSKTDEIILQSDENDDYQWVTHEEFEKEDQLNGNKELITQLYAPLLKSVG